MKKKVLSFIALAVVAMSAIALSKSPIFQKDKSEVLTLQNYAVPAGEVEINETNFPGVNFRKYVSKYDKDNSGSLSANEINAVTVIDCSNKSIRNMKGIEFFTSLKKLNCNFNPFDYSLDLSMNTNLTYLSCKGCSLKKLDVSNNLSLTYLDCNYNKLTTLDVSGNKSLKTLYCCNSSMESLNVCNNPELIELYCDESALTSLDVRSCPKLSKLFCSNNSLTDLDMSNNSQLTILVCCCNSITSLDVSKCKDLRVLDCEYNQLSALDVAENKKIRCICCFGNKITELDVHLCPILLDLVKTETRKEEISSNGNYYYYGDPEMDTGSLLSYDKNVNLITTGPSVGKVTGLKAVSAGRNKVKLNWNAVEGAEGYLVYAQKDGKYAYVGMTTKGTTFTDTKALDSDYNYYWVFAYVKDIDGSMVPGGCEKYVYAKGVCLAVTNLKATSQTGSVNLSWTASAGAEGYLIYGIRPGGSYGYIGMTTKGTTYTDTKASKTDYTFYWVFPCHKDADGTMIVGGTAKYTYGKAR
jgi:Leucine-rich repeat (LRR) protein